MGLFRKTINEEKSKAFFVMAVTKILSADEMGENEERLKQFKGFLPFLKNVKQADFDRQLSAVNIVWLKIAWSKYSYFKKGVSPVENSLFLTRVDDNIQKNVKSYKSIESDVEMYYNLASSPYADAINENLANLFVQEIQGKDFEGIDGESEKQFDETALVISRVFVKTLDLYTKEIKKQSGLFK